jgi:CBS-domain-containing membrane protein
VRIRVRCPHGLSWLTAPFAAGQLQALVFCTWIAAGSQLPGWGYLLFPELAALSSAVLRDPTGPWASRPWQLIVLPVVTGCLGVLLARQMADPALALLLAVAAARLVLQLARSPLLPALSAAALPVILQIHSWVYPAQIGLALAALAGLLRLSPQERDVRLAPSAEGTWASLLRWLAFLVLLLLIERCTGLHNVLVPPLIVMAHEALVSSARCAWAGRGWILPLACGGAALAGVLAAQWLPSPALATALSLAVCLLLQERLRLRLPPLLALGLLPLVLPAPDLRLVPAVMLGALLLVLSQRLPGSAARTPPPPAAAPDRSHGRR